MTPAVKFAEKHQVIYHLHRYEHDPTSHSYGLEAARKLNVDPARVFKTLVVEIEPSSLRVGIVPVSEQLNLKKLASALGVKKATMAAPEKVAKSTGYVMGGVSPLGQKRTLATVIDTRAAAHSTIYISAGKRGLDMELNPADLARLLDADFADLY